MKKQEKGQIIIILAVSLIAILGVTALAVDGSMIYRERREDQTTADSSALSAATTAASSTTCAVARTAAITAAQNFALAQEGVTLANDSSSPNRVEATCSADNKTLDIKIVVTSNPTTTFAKMVSRNELTTSVESVARVTFGGGSALAGGAMVALGNTCGAAGGIHALGNGQVRITGSGAFSNSCLEATGSSKILANGGIINYIGAGNIITPQNAPVLILGDSDPVNAPNISESLAPQIDWYGPNINIDSSLLPVEAASPLSYPDTIPMTAIAPPACTTGTPNTNPPGSGGTIYPGTYSSLNWSAWGNVHLTLSPGVYCFTGPVSMGGGPGTVTMDDTTLYFLPGSTSGLILDGNSLSYSMRNSTVYITNGNFQIGKTLDASNTKFYLGSGKFYITGTAAVTMPNSSIYLNNGNFHIDNGTISAQNISIYINQGSFIMNNGADGVNMSAPNCDNSSCGVGPAIKGMLLSMAAMNTGTILVDNGSSTGHNLSGTMYAPNALATFSGGTDTTATNVQIIAKRIQVDSGAKVNMNLTSIPLYSSGGAGSIELLK